MKIPLPGVISRGVAWPKEEPVTGAGYCRVWPLIVVRDPSGASNSSVAIYLSSGRKRKMRRAGTVSSGFRSGRGAEMEPADGSAVESAGERAAPLSEIGLSPATAPCLAGLVSASGTNGKAVVCERCGSRVLSPGTARYRRRELFLPSMRQKVALGTEDNVVTGDMLQEHWFVDDMYTFENVGFTKNVNNIKYLVCADCEIGPIGWHSLDDKKSFYIALDRVQHE